MLELACLSRLRFEGLQQVDFVGLGLSTPHVGFWDSLCRRVEVDLDIGSWTRLV